MGRGSGSLNNAGPASRNGYLETGLDRYEDLYAKSRAEFDSNYVSEFEGVYSELFNDPELAKSLAEATQEIVGNKGFLQIWNSIEFEYGPSFGEIVPTKESRSDITEAITNNQAEYKERVMTLIADKLGENEAKSFCSDTIRYQPDLLQKVESAISPRGNSIEESIRTYPNRYKDHSAAVDFLYQDAFHKSILGFAVLSNLEGSNAQKDKSDDHIVGVVSSQLEEAQKNVNKRLSEGESYFEALLQEHKAITAAGADDEYDYQKTLELDYYWHTIAYSTDNTDFEYGEKA